MKHLSLIPGFFSHSSGKDAAMAVRPLSRACTKQHISCLFFNIIRANNAAATPGSYCGLSCDLSWTVLICGRPVPFPPHHVSPNVNGNLLISYPILSPDLGCHIRSCSSRRIVISKPQIRPHRPSHRYQNQLPYRHRRLNGLRQGLAEKVSPQLTGHRHRT